MTRPQAQEIIEARAEAPEDPHEGLNLKPALEQKTTSPNHLKQPPP